jgi:hypothetical protein
MSELTIKLPDAKTPGYLRRLQKREEFISGLNDGTVNFEGLIEYLLAFVIEPEDRAEARDILMDASEDQYRAMLEVIIRSSTENPTQPTPNETN